MTATLAELVGSELGPSSWIDVTQERIDAFAAATDDHQWIHVDAARASKGPFGSTIAHGYLTLSLVVPMLYELLRELRPGESSGELVVNYGVDRVRFPAPVPAGSRIRGRFRLTSFEESARGGRASIEATVEVEELDKPVCVAELVILTVS